MIRLSTLPLATALLAACAAPPPLSSSPATTASSSAAAPGIRVIYDCDDGGTLQVRFDADTAYVRASDGTELRLPQQRAASGIWYATPQHELRGKGDDATWTIGRRVPVACKARR